MREYEYDPFEEINRRGDEEYARQRALDRALEEYERQLFDVDDDEDNEKDEEDSLDPDEYYKMMREVWMQ